MGMNLSELSLLGYNTMLSVEVSEKHVAYISKAEMFGTKLHHITSQTAKIFHFKL